MKPVDPFELLIAVEPGDIDELGHVNNVTYLRWVQEVAVAHWKATSRPTDQAALRWVVLRHEIDYKLAAHIGPMRSLRELGWEPPACLRFERHTELLLTSDRALLGAGTHGVVPD